MREEEVVRKQEGRRGREEKESRCGERKRSPRHCCGKSKLTMRIGGLLL